MNPQDTGCGEVESACRAGNRFDWLGNGYQTCGHTHRMLVLNLLGVRSRCAEVIFQLLPPLMNWLGLERGHAPLATVLYAALYAET